KDKSFSSIPFQNPAGAPKGAPSSPLSRRCYERRRILYLPRLVGVFRPDLNDPSLDVVGFRTGAFRAADYRCSICFVHRLHHTTTFALPDNYRKHLVVSSSVHFTLSTSIETSELF